MADLHEYTTKEVLNKVLLDSSGNAVDLRLHALGDGPRGEIYTYTNHPLAFATNNAAPQMTLDTGGRLGINQTPATNNFALQVTGLQTNGTDGRVAYFKGYGTATSIGSTGPALVIQNANNTVNNYTKLSFESAGAGETVSINSHNRDHSNHYGDMAFNTRGSGGYSEKMRIDSAGNVGLGNSSPSALYWPNGTTGGLFLQAGGLLSAYNAGTVLSQNWYYNGGEKYIANGSASRYTQSGAEHLWESAGNNTSGAGASLTWSEAMRISDGNLLVGTTATSSTAIGAKILPSGRLTLVTADSGTQYPVTFGRETTGAVGSITTTASATAYNTSSDQRLKENIVDAPSASDDIDAIQVRSFDWKADGSHQKYGMVAQELNTVAPEAVSTPEDSEEMMGVDYSKLVPMLVKEIQSLRARVAQLETN